MTRLLSIGLAGSTRLLLLAALCLGGYVAWQSHCLSRARAQLAAQQKIVRQQAGQIDTLNQWRALSDAPSGKDNV